MTIPFSTERLDVRSFTARDADAMFELYGDPDVVRYIGMPPVKDLAEMRAKHAEIVARYDSLPPGIGGFAILEKGGKTPVGNLLCKPLPIDGKSSEDIEIGWHLVKRLWGRGYITEVARALLFHAFDTLDLPRVHCVVEPVNTRSLAVAKRLGLTHHGRTKKYYDGFELEYFTLEQTAWRASLID